MWSGRWMATCLHHEMAPLLCAMSFYAVCQPADVARKCLTVSSRRIGRCQVTAAGAGCYRLHPTAAGSARPTCGQRLVRLVLGLSFLESVLMLCGAVLLCAGGDEHARRAVCHLVATRKQQSRGSSELSASVRGVWRALPVPCGVCWEVSISSVYTCESMPQRTHWPYCARPLCCGTWVFQGGLRCWRIPAAAAAAPSGDSSSPMGHCGHACCTCSCVAFTDMFRSTYHKGRQLGLRVHWMHM
jgi:hypothetical protein